MQSPKYTPSRQELLDKLGWTWLSKNQNAIDLLEKYPKNINKLLANPNMVHLLEKYPEKIDWNWLLKNSNANANHLLEHVFLKYPKK